MYFEMTKNIKPIFPLPQPDRFTLKQSQKNDILRLIQNTKLDPVNFKWNFIESGFRRISVPKISYRNTDFFFIFDREQEYNAYYLRFRPGSELLDGFYQEIESWEKVVHVFRSWLENLEEEINEPDLWVEIQKYSSAIDTKIIPDISNEPFNYQEVQRIISGIEEIKGYIFDNIESSHEHEQSVNDHLNYLAETVKTQGRRNWYYTCIGVIIGICWDLVCAPEHANTIWNIMKNTVTGIIKFLPMQIK